MTSLTIELLGKSVWAGMVEMSRVVLYFINIIYDENHLLRGFIHGGLVRSIGYDLGNEKNIVQIMQRKFIAAISQQLSVEVIDLIEQHKISSILIFE